MDSNMKIQSTFRFIASASLIACLAIISSSNAFAEWRELGADERADISVDTATLMKTGDTAQILSMLDFQKPGEDPKTKQAVNSIIGLNEYNCVKAQYRPIEFKLFSGNRGKGKVVLDSKTPDSVFESIADGSWAAGVFNVACRGM